MRSLQGVLLYVWRVRQDDGGGFNWFATAYDEGDSLVGSAVFFPSQEHLWRCFILPMLDRIDPASMTITSGKREAT